MLTSANFSIFKISCTSSLREDISSSLSFSLEDELSLPRAIRHTREELDDVEAYNKCDEMPLFTDFCKKIEAVEKNLPKDVLPWKRKGVKRKIVTVG